MFENWWESWAQVAQIDYKCKGLAPHAADLTPKPYVSTQNYDPGTFPSSRLDSH